MFQVEIYGRVRRADRVEGRRQRAVAKEFGLSRKTVRKMLQYAVPPGYQRQPPIKRTISFDAVRHLVLCRIERRSLRLDMESYPHLPMAQVKTTQAAD
jgi:ribosomal protein S14